ncbi:MAG: hypothetical protein M1400_01430 [Patescibacteria group bacterium]|nr:hypothetical protein [Patescibacteria group bacterium]
MAEPEKENSIRRLFEDFENLSEQGRTAEALAVIDRASVDAAAAKRSDLVVEALNHKLHIFKHLYQKTGQEIYLLLMRSEAFAALALADRFQVSGAPKAAALLRYADTFYMEGKYQESTALYAQALEVLPKTVSGAYAEFLSHYAISELKWRQNPEALKKLLEALSLAEADGALRPFHKLIILSGIQARLAEASTILNNRAESEQYFTRAEENALKLEREYGMPMRRIQLENLKQQLNL